MPHSYSLAFEKFWNAYPHPGFEGSKWKAYQKWLGLTEEEQGKAAGCLEAYRHYCHVTEWYHPRMAQTFLNQRTWETVGTVADAKWVRCCRCHEKPVTGRKPSPDGVSVWALCPECQEKHDKEVEQMLRERRR